MAYATEDCYKYNASNVPGLDPTKPASLTNYIGCNTIYSPGPCMMGGKITIIDGTPTTLTTVVCGVSTTKMLSITSQPDAAKDAPTTITPAAKSSSRSTYKKSDTDMLTITSHSPSNQNSAAKEAPPVTTITQPQITPSPDAQTLTTPQVDGRFSATATVTQLIAQSGDIPTSPATAHTSDWVDTVYFVVPSQSISRETIVNGHETIVSDHIVSVPQSQAATLYITGGGTQYTEATQFTSVISTTDATGHSTNVPVIVVVQPTVSKSEAQKPQSLYTITTRYTSMITTTDKNGFTTTIPAVIVRPIVVTTSPTYSTAIKPMATSLSNTTSTSNQLSLGNLLASEKVVDRTFDTLSYVAATYFPPLLAVIIKIVWEIIYATFKMIEPFHRMSSHDGSLAKRSLFAQYLSNSLSIDALKSCFSGHALSMLTTLVYVQVTLLATVAASSMTVRPTANCEVAPGQFMTCNPVWVINTTILRILEALLILCAVLTISIIASTRSYKTGVSANPSSIASVASLMNQQALVQDFCMSDPQARGSELASSLRNRKCKLEYHEVAPGTYRYGIGRALVAALPDLQSHRTSAAYSMHGRPHSYVSIPNPGLASSDTDRPLLAMSRTTRLWLWDTLQLLTSMGLFAIVAVYRFDFEPDAFNNFFGSGSWSSRLVIVAIASGLDMLWKRLEREVRITEPYRRMAKEPQRPETTVLMDLSGTCWSQLAGSLYKMLQYQSMWFQTLVSFVAVLSDLNIIAVASVVWSGGQTVPAFNISCAFVMSITGLMIMVSLLIMFWWRSGVVRMMPRSPSTIGAVFSYMCASRFAASMGSVQAEEVSREERDEMVIASRLRFSFGWRIGLDGRERWMVDFEAPKSHRVSSRQA